ncbi:CheR family methyltransferase [Cupriavidus pampae]|nr:protein-glutamate O-methyltransferase CheR [Cupriavidus pampae]
MTDPIMFATPIGIQIAALLKERIGLDADTVGPGTVARAVRDRQLAVGAHDTAAYWNVLHAAPDELQALIEAVIVPETWFFRHREALLALARAAAQRVFGGSGETGAGGSGMGEPPLLRVLSVPCSTGEEPYSIAMALLDAGIPADRFRVDAIDISARSLERARIGLYGPNAFRGLPLDYRDRHFTPASASIPGGYQIDARVRAQVRLLRGNLMDPLLLANEPPYHFVFCRNLLIYFDADTQRRTVRTLTRLTVADGMLFVGPAEASLLTREGLRGTGVPLAFAFHPVAGDPLAASNASWPPVSAVAAKASGLFASSVASAAPPPSASARNMRPVAAMAARTTAPPTATASIVTSGGGSNNMAERIAAADRAAVTALIDIAARADRGELAEATTACLDYLDTHGQSADAWCLLGVLHDAAARTSDAQAAYRKAVYLDPGHEEALYHLAALLDSVGDAPAATRLRQRAQRHARLNHG